MFIGVAGTAVRHGLWTFLLLAALLAAAPSAHAQDAGEAAFGARVLTLTNAERERAGLEPLSLSPELEDAAQSYSEVLASSGCFEHACGPTPDFADRAAAAGYTDWTALGENLAAGYGSPEAVVAGWMASPGHRANILSPRFTETGIGVARGDGQYGAYWAMEFGARP